MLKTVNKNITIEDKLYNNMLLLSRNEIFYTKFNLSDTFQNRIHLIFLHIAFVFNKVKQTNEKNIYKSFYQKVFDTLFKHIELNMREIGYGDVSVNKNMKFLITNFYNILIFCEQFNKKNSNKKSNFLAKYLNTNIHVKRQDYTLIIKYFDKYQTFCLDLASDSVLKGNLKFDYK